MDEASPSEVRESYRIQALLAQVGARMGHLKPIGGLSLNDVGPETPPEIAADSRAHAASRMSQGRKSFTDEFHRVSRAVGPGQPVAEIVQCGEPSPK